MKSCMRNMEIKKWLYTFFSDALKDMANRQIIGRIASHRLKLQTLGGLFDREFQNLKAQAFANIKIPRYKEQSQALLSITPERKEVFIKEYF